MVHVLAVASAVAESLATLVALVRLLAGVKTRMLGEVVFVLEAFLA